MFLRKLFSTKLMSEVVVRGLGGMHPPEATYVFDSAIPRGSFNVVVLEVMTSGYRQEGVSLEDFGLALLQLTAKALRRGAHVIILNLPRRDVDYQSDESTRVAANISDDVGADFLDLASEMTTEQIDRDLLDGIHTTAVSAAAFASRVATVVLDRLGETPRRLSLEVLQVADSAQSALAYNLVPYAETLNLERSFNPSGVAIPGGTVLDVILYGETRVAGVTYFMGPRTGMLTIRSEGHNNLLINAYDAFCYTID